MAASTSSTRMGSSTAARLKAGTTPSVTVEMIPSAPRPTRAQWNSSDSSVGEQSTALPSASTSRRATIWPASPVSNGPVPCVEVEVAPAMVW